MRTGLALIVVSLLAVGGIGLVVGGSQEEQDVKLAIGVEAPNFSLPGSDGKTHSLADHLGKRAVVIAWFPKAFTGG